MAELIKIPFKPRIHQRQAYDQMQRFNVLVWHRRAGKTVFSINRLLRKLLECARQDPRVAYLAPTYKQVKRVAWSYVKRYSECIPGVRYYEQELRATFPGGRELWLLGAMDCDSLRGVYLDECVVDEVAQMPTRLWGEVIRPALSDRGGGATLIGTPFGTANLFHQMYTQAHEQAGWYRSLLKWDDTSSLPYAEIEALRRELTADEFAQEYECSFTAAVRGAYYAVAMSTAERENRLGRVPRDPLLPVHSSWDLGIANRTIVCLWQTTGAEIRCIGARAYAGTGLPEIIADLKGLNYSWGQHYAPHDSKVRELGSGKSRQEIAQALGMTWTIVPQIGVQSGIDTTRAMLSRCYFDAENCKDLIEALRLYRTEFDDERRVFSLAPLHDWTSDYADSVRMFAVGSQGKNAGWATLDYRPYDKVVA